MLAPPSPFRETLRPRLLASVFGASLLVAGPALAEGPALPSGGSVAAGVASIATGDSGVTVTQSTNRAVVNWNSFSVGQGRTVAFDLPGANAAVLNRVTGDLPSSIAGALTSNGRVFLVNPNGVAITATGQVRVGGGFTASTLDVANSDFMAGRLVFTGASRAEVSNAGAIYVSDGGQVALIGGGRVRNTGLISAPLGQVALGSGSAITLDPGGDGFLQILAPPVLEADGGVEVGGQVLAAGGRVVVRADAVERTVRDLVNLTGEVNVASARSEGGSVILDAGAGGLAASGRIDATSGEARGGRIALGGDSITLSGARLDAGGASGGEITVGGGWQGAPVPGVTTARSTQVDADSRLEASGSAGAGGRVILWSDDDTRFRGRIQATGNGGDGGVAEVSSHGVYLFDGQVNLLSRGGKAGQLLLDPYNVTISTGADANQSGFTATGDSAVINVTSLQNALAGASVTVSTGSSGTQAGNITLSNALSWSADTTLTLNAAGAITLNAAVTNSGTGSGLELISPGTISLSSAIANSGTLTVNGAGTATGALSGPGRLVKTGAGTLTMGLNGPMTWTGATSIASGTLFFTAPWNAGSYAGDIDIASGATLSFWNGNQTLSGVISGTGTISTSGSGGQVLTLTGQNTFNGTILTGSYSVVVAGSGVLGGGNFSGTLTTNSTGGAGAFRYSSSADQILSGTISGTGGITKDTSSTSTLTLTGAASHSGTTISAGTVVFGGASTHTQGVTINAGGTLRYSTSASQALNIAGAGALIKDTAPSTLSWGNLVFTGPITIDAGTIDLPNGAAFGGGNAIDIGAAGTLRFSKWSTYTHSGVISGTGTLTQAGSSITLTGANPFNGTINIIPTNQSLIIGGSGSLGGGNFSGAINNAGTFTYSSSADQTLSGVISGGGGLAKNTSAASTLTLTGANTFTGGITNSAGTLVIGGSSSLGGGTYAGAISNAGTLRYSSSVDQTLSGVISGAGTLVKDTAASTLYLTGANTYTGATTLAAGNLRIDAANASSGITTSAGTLLGFSNSGAVTYAGVISGPGDFRKAAAGVLTLTGLNTFTGNTTITAGTLRISGSGSLAGGSYAGDISNAGTFQYGSSANQTLSGVISGAGSITKDTGAASTLTLTGTNTYTGGTTISAGTLQVGGSGSLGNGDYAGGIAVSGTFRYSSSADQTLSGVISGGGALLKDTAASTLTLTGVNTYTGATTLSGGGTLRISGAGSLGSGTYAGGVSIGAGSTLQYSSSTTQTLSGVIAGAGVVVKDTSANTLILSGNNTYTGGTTLSAGTLRLIGSNATATISLAAGTQLDYANTAAQTYAGVITGPGSLLKSAAGNLILTGTNTYTGATAITGGQLTIGGAGTLGSGAYAANISNAGTLIYSSSADQTLSGVISGAGGLTKNTSAASTLTLTGTNTFTGAITNTLGTLVIGGAGQLNAGSYAANISNAGTLRYASSADQTLSGSISGAGTLVKEASPSTLILSGSLTYTGATTVSAGTLQINGGASSSGFALSAGTLLHFANATNQSYTGVISGAGNVRKSAAGTMALSGANTFTGSITVASGTLQIGGGGSLGGGNYAGDIANAGLFQYRSTANQVLSGVLSGAGTYTKDVGATSTLTLTGANTFTGTLDNTSAGTLEIGGAGTLSGGNHAGAITTTGVLRFSTSADQVLSGVINIGGNLVKAGLGSTLTLTGSTVGGGSITVSEGTLQVGGAGLLNTGHAINVTGLLRYSSSANQTLSGVISGSGQVLKDTSTTNTLILSAANTYTGATTVSAGVLRLQGANASSGIGIAPGAQLDYSNGGAVTYAGVISGPGTFQKSAAGVLTLTGASTLTGPTTISAGELKIGGAGTLGSGTYAGNISNAGTLRYSSNANQVLSGVISGAGALIKDTDAASTLTLTGTNTFTGAITNTLGTLAVGGAGSLGSGTYAGAISNAGTLRYSSSVDQTLSGVISGAGALVKDTAASTLILTGANTYTGASSVSLGTLRLTAANASSGVAISAGALLDYANAGAVTYAGVLSGAGALQKSAAGVLTLSGANTFTGGVTFAAGTLLLNSAGAIGSSGALAFSGGTLQHSASNLADHSARVLSTGGQQVRIDTNGQAVTYATGIDGAGTTLNKLGTGTLTLTGTSGYTGATTITAGELKIGGAGSLGAGTYAANISNAGTLRYSSSANQTLAGVISGAGALIKDTDAASALTLTGVNTFTGAITNSAGTLVIGGAGQLNSGSYAGAISNAGTLRYSSSADQVLSGLISGAGSVVKDTSATSVLTLSGTGNTFTGGAALNAGTLRVSSGNALGSTGAISFAGGTLQYSGNSQDFSGRFLTTGNQPIRIDTNGLSPTFASVIAGADTSLTKLGAGVLTLSAMNTFTGDLSLSGGEVRLSGAGTLGGGNYAGAIAIASGAVFSTGSSVSQVLSGVISGSGEITKTSNSGALLSLTGANTFSGAITILANAGTIQVGGAGVLGGGVYNGAVTIGNAGVFRYSSSADQVMSGVITGSGAFTKDTGASILTLSGANGLTGTTTVSAGTLRAGAANGISGASTTNVNAPGILDVNGFSVTTGVLGGGGTVTNNGGSPGTLTINYGSGSSTFAGVLQDGASPLSLAKTGGGTQLLSGASTFTGGITITGGYLGLSGAGVLGGANYSGAISIASGAGFSTGSSANQVLSGVISGTGDLAKTANIGALLTLTGANTFNGTISIAGNAGTIQLGGAGVLGGGTYSGAISMGSAGAIRYSSTADQVFSGAISGAGALTKDTGASTLTLAGSGTATFMGATTVSAGVLRAGAANAFSTGSAMNVNSGGALDVNGYASPIGHLTGNGVVTNNGAAPATLTINLGAGNQTFAGVLQDGASALSLAKAGNGNQFLTGANTFTGGINVNAGLLALSGSGTLGGGAYAGNIAIASGAVFDPQTSAAQTLSGVISGAGGLNYTGGVGGSLTLTGVNTYTGPTTLGGYGVLTIGGAGVLGGGAYAGNIVIGGSSSFRYSSSADQTLSGTISGGPFTKDTAASKLTVTGAYSTGTLTVNAGEFILGGAGTRTGGNLILGAAGTFRSSTSTDLQVSGNISGAGTFIKDTSTSSLTLNNTIGLTGPLIVNAGTLRVGSSNFVANNLVLGPAGIFDSYCNCSYTDIGVLSGSGRVTSSFAGSRSVSIASGDFSGVIENGAGTVGLTKTTTGTLVLRGASTFTGPVAVNAGTLQVADAATLAGGAYSGAVALVGTLRYSSSADQTLSGIISGNGTLVKDTNASILTLTGANTYTGAMTIGAGTLRIGGAGVLGNGTYAGAISNSGVVQFSSTAAQTLSGVISGTGDLVKDTDGASTLILSGNNTYTGATTLSAGTLRLVGSNATPTVSLAAGTLLDYANTAAQTYAGVIAGAGDLQKSAAGVLTLTGVQTYTGGTTITAGELKIGGAGSLGSGAYGGAISNAGILRYSSTADQVLSGVISGAGGLAKDTSAASFLTLSGANTYTGATTFGAGFVQLGSADAVGTTGALAFSGGTLRHGAANTVDYSSRILSTGGQLVRIDTNGQAVTWASGLSGAGTSLTKLGAGTLSLTANSGFTGGLTIAEGELRFSGAGALGGGTYAGAISNAGTLRYSSTADQTFSGALSGAGALVKDTDAAAILTLTGANTLTGPITIGAGTLRIGGSSVLGGGAYAGNLTNNGVLRYASSADQVLSGVISGTGSVVKDTSAISVLTLSGANTFGGQLKVDAGAVDLDGSWSPVGGAASVRVGAGARLEGSGVVSAATLALAGPGHVDLDGPNQVDAVSATGAIGGVSLVNARTLSAGSIEATDMIRLRATGASDIILAPGAVLQSAASGDAVVLGAGRNFLNTSGAAAVVTPAGRWLVYSTRPADNQFGGLNSAQVALWGQAPLAAVTETGNRYVFTQAPVLTVSTASFSKPYGVDISPEIASGYSISGYDPGVSGAYLGDSFSTALRGAPFIGSDGARADAPVGTYAVYASGGSLVPVTGYALAFNATGLLTVEQAVLTVRARSLTKVYDGLSLSTGAGVDITGWIPGDGPSGLTGTLTYSGSFVGASDAGTYQILPGGLTSQNYTVRFLPGTLTITPAPLTVTVLPVSRTYDGGAFSGGGGVTYGGFVNGQSASVLGGTLAFGGTAQGAVGAGTYTLTASGLSSGNYTISYVPGALTIRPAPLTVTARDVTRTYDATAWSGGAGVVIDGLVGKDAQADLTGTLAYGGSSQGAMNAGTYDITVSGLSSPNYEIRYVGGRLVIQKSVVTVAADPVTKSFDGTPFTGTTTVTVTGLAGQDTPKVLTGELVFTGAARGAVEIGTYEIIPSGLTSQNYEIRYLAGTLQVVPAPVTVTARPRLEYVCRAAITLLGEQACQPVDDYAGFVDEPRASVDLFVPPPSAPADGSLGSRMD